MRQFVIFLYCLLIAWTSIDAFVGIKLHGNRFMRPLRTVSDNKASVGWFDEAVVFVRGGSGGHGSSAQKFGKARQHVHPNGGSGGDGGSVVFVVNPNMNTLQKFRALSNFRAGTGADGEGIMKNGLAATDVLVHVPAGTIVKDNSTDAVIGTLTSPGQRLVVAQGGMGGRGNGAKGSRGERLAATPPQGGQRRWLRLELQLIADIGLLGAPNAGKSTLLQALTSAKPKIASYAFTTLVPNLGVAYLRDHIAGYRGDDNDAMVVADIPGLIEGAHRGLGLGRGFLRHVDRCEVLIHVLDSSLHNVTRTYTAINRELALYSSELAAKPQVVVLNKVDLLPDRGEALKHELAAILPHSRLLCISAACYDRNQTSSSEDGGVRDLLSRTWAFLQRIRADRPSEPELTAAQMYDLIEEDELLPEE